MHSARSACSSKALRFGEIAGQFGAGSENRSPLSTTGDSRRLRVRRSIKPSCLYFGLASTTPPQKTRSLSSPYGQKLTTLVLESTDTGDAGPSESRRAGSVWNRGSSVGERKSLHHVQNELRPRSTPHQKCTSSSKGDSPTQSPKVNRSGTSRGSTGVTRLSPLSSNETANWLRLCNTKVSNLLFLLLWLFFDPLLNLASDEEVFSSLLEKIQYLRETVWVCRRKQLTKQRVLTSRD